MLVKDFDAMKDVGDFYFHDGDHYITLRYGQNWTQVVTLPIGPKESGPGESIQWSWNGDHVKPTLAPSILVHGDNGWHGYLRDGLLVGA